jgi:hypothetical protein
VDMSVGGWVGGSVKRIFVSGVRMSEGGGG